MEPHGKSRVVMVPTLSSLVAPLGATSVDKVGIVKTLIFFSLCAVVNDWHGFQLFVDEDEYNVTATSNDTDDLLLRLLLPKGNVSIDIGDDASFKITVSEAGLRAFNRSISDSLYVSCVVDIYPMYMAYCILLIYFICRFELESCRVRGVWYRLRHIKPLENCCLILKIINGFLVKSSEVIACLLRIDPFAQ